MREYSHFEGPLRAPLRSSHIGYYRIFCETGGRTPLTAGRGLDTAGRDFVCERRLVEEAQRVNQLGKMLAPIVDDAHLMDVHALRRLRLLLEDFPKNHNLVLFAQPQLLHTLALTVNDDSRAG